MRSSLKDRHRSPRALTNTCPADRLVPAASTRYTRPSGRAPRLRPPVQLTARGLRRPGWTDLNRGVEASAGSNGGCRGRQATRPHPGVAPRDHGLAWRGEAASAPATDLTCSGRRAELSRRARTLAVQKAPSAVHAAPSRRGRIRPRDELPNPTQRRVAESDPETSCRIRPRDELPNPTRRRQDQLPTCAEARDSRLVPRLAPSRGWCLEMLVSRAWTPNGSRFPR